MDCAVRRSMDGSSADEDESDSARADRAAFEARAVRLDEPIPAKLSGEPRPVRIGVACMTKKPSNFDVWLRHHHHHVGAERFYLRVEDTPDLSQLLSRPPWDNIAKARFATKMVRDWHGQTRRQMSFVDDAIEDARADGMSHLLFLDDDELLYLPHGQTTFVRIVERLPSQIVNVHALTLEALVPSIECDNPFTSARAFKHKPADYSSYGSARHNAGKSLGVLRCKRLHCAGPHHFSKRRQVYEGPTQDSEKLFDWSETYVCPASVACILHYESCTYARWLIKFGESAQRLRRDGSSDDAAANAATGPSTASGGGTKRAINKKSLSASPSEPKQGYLFQFYCESLGACSRRLRALGTARPHAIQDAEAYCRDLWCKWKVEPPGLVFPRADEAVRIDDSKGLTLLPAPVVTEDDEEADAAEALAGASTLAAQRHEEARANAKVQGAVAEQGVTDAVDTAEPEREGTRSSKGFVDSIVAPWLHCGSSVATSRGRQRECQSWRLRPKCQV